MEHSDATQIITALQKQNELLARLATSFDRTNELVFALLSPEQRQAVQKAGAERLAKNLRKAPNK